MKTFKLLLISLSLAVILASCGLAGGSASPTQTIDQKLAGTFAAMTLQNSTNQTQTAVINATNVLPAASTSPLSTPAPPNTPVWVAYNYTCQFVANGGNMTMNLAWTDHSNSEEGYNVYRDNLIIATLAPNSTFYVDNVFVATGKTVSYSVEAFNKAWRADTSTITYGCR